MLTVSYRGVGETEHKVFVSSKLTYIGHEGEFALYDADDNIQVFIKPVQLEVKAVVNAPDN